MPNVPDSLWGKKVQISDGPVFLRYNHVFKTYYKAEGRKLSLKTQTRLKRDWYSKSKRGGTMLPKGCAYINKSNAKSCNSLQNPDVGLLEFV